MNYLAIDTSAEHLTVVARVGKKSETFYSEVCGAKHSEMIIPAVESVLNKLDALPSDIDVFCSVVGPGSFTGIRIGVSTVKGFADALKKPVLGVTSFDTLAYNIQSGKVVAAIDARHGCYYACPYLDNKALTPAFVTEEGLKETAEGATILTYPYTAFAVDGKTALAADPAKGLKKAVEDRLDEADENVDSLKPLYLRLSQAEEGRK